MTDSILDPQDGPGGVGSSHEADVTAGFDESGDAATDSDAAAEGGAADSHSADVEAGFSDEPE